MVSVVIPNYNHAKFLKKRIDTVLSQTYQDFNLIILDDCSLDNSKEIIEQYRYNHKVSYIIYNELNSGAVFKQWKRGVELAKGDYIWVAESDDFAAPTFLETMVQELDKRPEVGIVYSNSVIVDEYERPFDSWAKRRKKICRVDKWKADYTAIGIAEIQSLLLYNCTINNASAVLFRRNLLVQHLDTIATFRYVGDWYAYMAILKDSNLTYVHQDLNFYREHQKNASMQSYENGMQFYERYQCRSLILPSLIISDTIKERLYQDLAYEYLNYWLTFLRKKNVSSTDFLKLNACLLGMDKALFSNVMRSLAAIGLGKFRKQLTRLWGH